MRLFHKNNSIVLLFLISAFAVFSISMFSSSLMTNTSKSIEYNLQERLMILSQALAELVSAEDLTQLQKPADMDTPLYQEVKKQINEFATDADASFAYYVRDVNGMLQYIVDNEYDPATSDGLNSSFFLHEAASLNAWKDRVTTCSGVGDYTKNWPGYITAYTPVLDDSGKVIALACVDLTDEHIVASKHNLTLLASMLRVAILIALLSGLIGFFLYRRKAEEADGANIAKSTFLSRMSHEIRTPMNAIIGLCRVSEKSDNLNEIKDHLDTISVSSTHLLGLINDILDLSKIETGKVVIEMHPMNLREEINSITKIISSQIEAKQQKFEVTISPDLPEWLICDAVRIRQIVVNLLSNAVKFTPVQGKITCIYELIEQKDNQCHMKVTVVDTGIGIDQKQQESLFAPFVQADNSTTRKYGGTGLGLSISKQLAEMMGGGLGVKSTIGQGSAFFFDVWAEIMNYDRVDKAYGDMFFDDYGFASYDKSEETMPVDLAGQTVLVAEDVEINQVVAESCLEDFGCRIEFANDGQEALDMYLDAPERYAIIFMDIQMPVMDGYEAVQHIRKSGKSNAQTIPIIAMTANVFKEDVQKAYDAGMDAHVGKPIDMLVLEDTIRSVLVKAESRKKPEK